MSALILSLYLEHVFIATDRYSAGILGRAQILFPLPMMAAVIAGRGSARLLALIAADAALTGGGFDARANGCGPIVLVQPHRRASDETVKNSPRETVRY